MLLLSDGWKTARYYKTSTGETEIIDELEIRVDGKFRYKNSKKELFASTSGVYPTISPYLKGGKNKASRFAVHILMISTFCETPKEKNILVDHIDRNTKNFNLNNLRFVSQSENLLNRNPIKSYHVYVIFDILGNFKSKLTTKEGYIIEKVRRILDYGDTVYSFSSDSFDRLEDKLRNIGSNYLDSLDWRKIDDNHFISNIGLLKIIGRAGLVRFTFGTVDAKGYYVGADFIKGHSSFMHILVAEYFLNNKNKLPEDKFIDHIDTDRRNNSFDNLRIVTQKENLNNPNTLKKLSTPIKCNIDSDNRTVYFKGIMDCSRILKMNNPGSVCDWVKGRYTCTYPGLSNFQYMTEEEINDSDVKYINTFDELGIYPIRPRDIKTREEAIKFINDNKLTCKKDFIKNGLENFYNSFVKRFPPIVYYED